MIFAVFKIMWLRLWRDKGALVLAFILPGFIFAIFAAIFSNASGGNLDIRVALANVSATQDAQSFAMTLKESDLISVSFDEDWNEEEIKNRVRLGQDDVGVIIFGAISDPRVPSIRIIQDPSREVATTVLKGQIRQMLAGQSAQNTVNLFETVSALDNTVSTTLKDPSVTYYIGATAILFLLFSAMQGASISIDERRNGLSDRLMVGPVGAIGMLSGKFVFLTLIGFLQAAIICVVAVIFFDVSVAGKQIAIGIACLGASVLAAGLALLLASLCKTQTQMNAVSTFAVLLLSAIGGSMVPRFMMPGWLQDIGIFTPNYWSIEAFYGILARGQSLIDLLPVWGVLFGGGVFCLGIAAFLSHKLMRV
jgi:ABC-2 type transport system permease protein